MAPPAAAAADPAARARRLAETITIELAAGLPTKALPSSRLPTISSLSGPGGFDGPAPAELLGGGGGGANAEAVPPPPAAGGQDEEDAAAAIVQALAARQAFLQAGGGGGMSS